MKREKYREILNMYNYEKPKNMEVEIIGIDTVIADKDGFLFIVDRIETNPLKFHLWGDDGYVFLKPKRGTFVRGFEKREIKC